MRYRTPLKRLFADMRRVEPDGWVCGVALFTIMVTAILVEMLWRVREEG